MAASRNRRRLDLEVLVGRFLAARIALDAPLTVGLSGGCDSIVLLYLAARLRPGGVSALHVHHGLSPNADMWADFCSEQCARLNVPLLIKRVLVDRASSEGLEAAARRSRYTAYAAAADNILLLAQHRGDQAETLLFNLLRGAGVTGAAAIPPERSFAGKRLLRPLLEASRAEIEAFAWAEGLAWIDDESNRDTRFSRNFLRHQVLPLISDRFPAAEANLARAAANFAESAALLDDLAKLDWAAVAQADGVSLSALRGLPSLRIKNLLRFRLRQLGWRVPDASRLDEFVRQLQTAAPDRHPVLLVEDGCMRASRGVLRWVTA